MSHMRIAPVYGAKDADLGVTLAVQFVRENDVAVASLKLQTVFAADVYFSTPVGQPSRTFIGHFPAAWPLSRAVSLWDFPSADMDFTMLISEASSAVQTRFVRPCRDGNPFAPRGGTKGIIRATHHNVKGLLSPWSSPHAHGQFPARSALSQLIPQSYTASTNQIW